MKKEDATLALEVGVTTAIMSQGGRLEKLFKIIHDEIGCGGILDAAYTMSWFASEFLKLYEDTDWEQAHYPKSPMQEKFLYRSKKFKKRGGYKEAPQYVTCWDDAAEDYAQWKIENFTEDEFERINCSSHTKNPLLSDELDSGGIEIGDEVEIMCVNDFQSMKYNLGNTFKVMAIADVGSDNSLYVSEDLVTWFHPIDLKRL